VLYETAFSLRRSSSTCPRSAGPPWSSHPVSRPSSSPTARPRNRAG